MLVTGQVKAEVACRRRAGCCNRSIGSIVISLVLLELVNGHLSYVVGVDIGDDFAVLLIIWEV